MMTLYNETALECSQLITQRYSTSFSMGIRTLHSRFRLPICGIYGFVRFADEIVDTFHNQNKAELLARFTSDTWEAIETKISLNPVLQAFQLTVNKYNIDHDLIEAFLKSMEMDLNKTTYNASQYNTYIYGSAEVVGLMCLRVFCEGDTVQYDSLKASGRSLGAAFQKVNFLRDIRSDFDERGRVYFPDTDFNSFSQKDKQNIEADIQADFDAAYKGILRLPTGAQLGVYLAYIYYLRLFRKIKSLPPSKILTERVRVPDLQKMILLAETLVRGKLGYL